MPSKLTISRLYIWLQASFNLLLWVPIFYEFQKQAGLNDQQIFNIQSWYYILFCFFELPTGYVADRFGFKKSMIFGAICLAIGNSIPIWVTSYQAFFMHFLLIALARAFLSGAASAYLYDYLTQQNKVEDYRDIEASGRFVGLICKIVGWMAAGYVMAWDSRSPYILTEVASIIAVLIALRLPNLPVHRVTEKYSKKLSARYRIWNNIMSNQRLMLLMLQGASLFVLVRLIQVNLFQPLLLNKDYDVKELGLIMGMMTVAEAVGAKTAGKSKTKRPDLFMVFLATAVATLSMLPMAIGSKTFTLVGLIIFSASVGFAFPFQRKSVNDHITNKSSRASFLSLESLLDRGMCAIAVLPLGAAVSNQKISQALLIIAAAAAIFNLILYWALAKSRQVSSDVQ